MPGRNAASMAPPPTCRAKPVDDIASGARVARGEGGASPMRRAVARDAQSGWFIHENAAVVNPSMPALDLKRSPRWAGSINHPFAQRAHDVVTDRRRRGPSSVGVPTKLIGHADHKPSRKRPLERLPWEVPGALSVSGRHGMSLMRTSSSSPPELFIVDAVS
jgi:hypothetical protein